MKPHNSISTFTATWLFQFFLRHFCPNVIVFVFFSRNLTGFFFLHLRKCTKAIIVCTGLKGSPCSTNSYITFCCSALEKRSVMWTIRNTTRLNKHWLVAFPEKIGYNNTYKSSCVATHSQNSWLLFIFSSFVGRALKNIRTLFYITTHSTSFLIHSTVNPINKLENDVGFYCFGLDPSSFYFPCVPIMDWWYARHAGHWKKSTTKITHCSKPCRITRKLNNSCRKREEQ